jgi:hypothetical protein
VSSRLESLEASLEPVQGPISSSIDISHETPAISARCLSCNTPYQVPSTQRRQQQQQPLHGRAPLNSGFTQSLVKSDSVDRPSTPTSAFRVDELKPFLELHSSSVQDEKVAQDFLDVQVGRRAGRFGVEKLRPKETPRSTKR